MTAGMIALMVVGFVLFFAALSVLVFRIVSWVGWTRLQSRFAWDRPVPASATRYGWQTVVIGEFPRAASYRNAMNVWLDDAGIYLRPPAAFALFHPMLHLDWRRVTAAEPHRLLGIRTCRVSLDGDAPAVTFGGRAGEAVLEHWTHRRRAP